MRRFLMAAVLTFAVPAAAQTGDRVLEAQLAKYNNVRHVYVYDRSVSVVTYDFDEETFFLICKTDKVDRIHYVELGEYVKAHGDLSKARSGRMLQCDKVLAEF